MTSGSNTKTMPRVRTIAIALVSLLLASGCVSSYRPEIQQGNVITQEMVEKLKTGMTKSQVRFVLGTPLITDPFHPERWDYVYLYKKNVDAPAQTRQFMVIFDGDAMARTEGELAPPPATARDAPSEASGSDAPGPSSPARAL